MFYNTKALRRLAIGIVVAILIATFLGITQGASAQGVPNPGDEEFARAKCRWLRENFPQTTAGVQELGAKLAGVEKRRITTHEYRCSRTTAEAVFDGFVVLGPKEGFDGNVTLTVPKHGAIDGSDPSCGYTYTGEHSLVGDLPELCDDTHRATSGTVTGPRLTYYPYYDEDPPGPDDKFDPGISASVPTEQSVSAVTGECISGAEMARKMGWILLDPQPESVTKYGGAQVEVTKEATLPQGWEAKSNGPDLQGGDLLTPGFYSIYPPRTKTCRVDTLHVSE